MSFRGPFGPAVIIAQDFLWQPSVQLPREHPKEDEPLDHHLWAHRVNLSRPGH